MAKSKAKKKTTTKARQTKRKPVVEQVKPVVKAAVKPEVKPIVKPPVAVVPEVQKKVEPVIDPITGILMMYGVDKEKFVKIKVEATESPNLTAYVNKYPIKPRPLAVGRFQDDTVLEVRESDNVRIVIMRDDVIVLDK